MKNSFAIILFFVVLFQSYSQNNTANLRVNARAQENKILLRWAIDSPIEWQRANLSGYTVTKFIIKRDNKLLATPEKIILTQQPLLAEPLESWMDLIQRDNYAAIIAQAIYGESFQVGDIGEGELSKIINIAEELDQRYTFSLYAADMSFEGSVKAGWGYIDENIKANEEYAYQIAVAGISTVKPASYVISLNDFMLLPAPTDFIAIPDDRKALLSWDYETFKMIYSSFMVEKSEDGVNFTPISKTPLVNLNDKPDSPSKRMYYVDTLSVNNKEYTYRLYGISSFGEKGQYSKLIKVAGIGSLASTPRIMDYYIKNDDEVLLKWEFPEAEEKNLESFEIIVANEDKGPYTKVAENILPKTRELQYNKLNASNYFKIVAIAKNKQRLTSQSVLVQPIDSIPPVKPIGLTGVIDSLGVVTLRWKANTEKDLLGYRILRANKKEEEFVPVYHKSYTDTDYIDSVSLTMSDKKVYYRIMAEDRRFNMSEPSDILVLDKPDKIRPTAPIFKDYDAINGKVSLKWVKSYSDDVASHTLRRREKGELKWKDIISFTDDTQEHIDEKVEKNKVYEYAILAKDESGLWSTIESSIVTVQVFDFSPSIIIKNLQGIADRENKKISLTWSFNKDVKVSSISIYKNIEGEQPTLWKEIPAAITSIEDKSLKMNSNYYYQIVPTLSSNAPAKAEAITIKY